MDVSYYSMSKKITLKLSEENCIQSSAKFIPKNLTSYKIFQPDIDSDGKSIVLDTCLTARKMPSSWSGVWDSANCPDGKWRYGTCLGRLAKVRSLSNRVSKMKGTQLSESHLNFNIVHYVSIPMMDVVATVLPKHSVRSQAFPLNRPHAKSACIDVQTGLDYLHSLGVSHFNISCDAIVYAVDSGKHQLTDMYCLTSLSESRPEVVGTNHLYAWHDDPLRKRCMDMVESKRLRRLADCAAVVCVMAYACTLDESHLLELDLESFSSNRLVESRNGQSDIPESAMCLTAVSDFYKLLAEYANTFKNSLKTLTYLPKYLLDKGNQTDIAYTRLENHIGWDSTSGNIGSYFRDSVTFASSLDSKLKGSPTQVTYSREG